MSEKVVTGVEGAYQISDKGCEVLLTSLRPSLSRRARRLMDAQAEAQVAACRSELAHESRMIRALHELRRESDASAAHLAEMQANLPAHLPGSP